MTDTETKTIELPPPSWSGVLPLLLAVYQDAESDAARLKAEGELRRMANIADMYVKDQDDAAENQERSMWFIYSPRKEDWGGLRVATLIRARDQMEIVIIHNEHTERLGARVWSDVVEREGWIKVRPIKVPGPAEIAKAMQANDDQDAGQ